MKILYLLHSAAMDGSTISFMNLIEGVEKEGVEVVVVAQNFNPDIIKYLEKIGAKHFICPIVLSVFDANWPACHFLKRMNRSCKLWKRKFMSFYNLIKIARREHPDIIHTNVGVVHEGYFVAKFLNIPHVWHLREYQDKDFGLNIFPSRKRFEKILKQSYVITITKDILYYFKLVNSESHKVIYNGIMGEKDTCYLYPKEKFFLCASRISEEKGHDEVIRCFAEFYNTHNDYKLVILGFGNSNYIEYLKLLAKELKCDQAIDFVGFTTNVKSYMQKAKALIVASRYEGFGRMTAEASFMGCLVIGRNTGGTKEILDEVGGISFLTSSELLQSMNKCVEIDEKDYSEIVKAAQTKAIKLYSIENNIKETINFYKFVVDN